MKILNIVTCALLAIGVALPAGAFAQDAGFRPFMQGRDARQERPPGPNRPMPQRGMRARDDDERGRMSPEERRQLRQDIQNMGRDIYRPNRPPPMERRGPPPRR